MTSMTRDHPGPTVPSLTIVSGLCTPAVRNLCYVSLLQSTETGSCERLANANTMEYEDVTGTRRRSSWSRASCDVMTRLAVDVC